MHTSFINCLWTFIKLYTFNLCTFYAYICTYEYPWKVNHNKSTGAQGVSPQGQGRRNPCRLLYFRSSCSVAGPQSHAKATTPLLHPDLGTQDSGIPVPNALGQPPGPWQASSRVHPSENGLSCWEVHLQARKVATGSFCRKRGWHLHVEAGTCTCVREPLQV